MSKFKSPPAKILFQLSGSIACFKACALLSSLVKAGYDVEIVATPSALKFVGEATLEGLTGRRVHTDTFQSGHYMSHIHLVRWADLILLCPATANTLNKFTAGIGDDLVSTLFLAHDFKKPYLVVPAMNQTMYAHPATQKSLAALSEWGVTVLETGTGPLACGENGEGRMLEPTEIESAIELALRPTVSTSSTTKSMRLLITSGGTEEPIDGVRSITNTSTGRTGAELAKWFTENGNDVTLLHAYNAILPKPSPKLHLKSFTSFESLDQLLKATLASNEFDAVIHLAAVADYSLDEVESNGVIQKAPIKGKIDSGVALTLKLRKNPKLVDSIKAHSKNPQIKVVAFKLTQASEKSERAEAVANLAKHAMPDFIVHNDLFEIAHKHPFAVYERANSHPVSQAEGAQNLAAVLSTLLEGAHA